MRIRHPDYAQINATHAAQLEQIEAHPRFPDLVREVAVAEQGGGPGYDWLRRNSRTFGAWITRCTPPLPRVGKLSHRAWVLAELLAAELGIPEGPDRGSLRGVIFVAARDHVRCRSNGRPTGELVLCRRCRWPLYRVDGHWLDAHDRTCHDGIDSAPHEPEG